MGTDPIQLLGLEALHERNIYHCDLKPENILIASSGNLVIADFGLAIHQQKSQLCKGPFGTAHYSAREVWSRFQPAYADIWSYGAILLQMMLGTPEVSTLWFKHAFQRLTCGLAAFLRLRS